MNPAAMLPAQDPTHMRAYVPADKAALLAVLRQNTPRFFAASEEDDFITYLDLHREDYFVVETDHRIIGSGGINYFPDEAVARLSWDLLHPDFQGQGIGTQLTLHRIDHIRQNPAIRHVVVRTTQVAYGFYQKLGFTLEKMETDFWAPGFDLYQLRRPLTPAAATRG